MEVVSGNRRSFSEDDQESIYSYQGKETDIVQDTGSLSEGFSSSSALEVALEYEVASSDSDAEYHGLNGILDGVSSSGEDDVNVTAAIAAVLCDSTLEAWATDGEESDTFNDSVSSVSSLCSVTGQGRRKGAAAADFWSCAQCQGRNDQPQVRYCDKCFQLRCWQCKMRKNYKCFPLCNACYKIRKNFFPPRPRRALKRKLERAASAQQTPSQTMTPVKLDTLRNCLSGLSQDSGLGSSQEIPGLNFDQISVPKQPEVKTLGRKRSSSSFSEQEEETKPKMAKLDLPGTSRAVDPNLPSTSKAALTSDRTTVKRQLSSSSSSSDSDVAESAPKSRKLCLSDDAAAASKQHCPPTASDNDASEVRSSVASVADDSQSTGLPELQELCIICNLHPKNGIFLHGSIGHLCCCYKCAMKTWRMRKRCPVCNCKVRNVVKVFTT